MTAHQSKQMKQHLMHLCCRLQSLCSTEAQLACAGLSSSHYFLIAEEWLITIYWIRQLWFSCFQSFCFVVTIISWQSDGDPGIITFVRQLLWGANVGQIIFDQWVWKCEETDSFVHVCKKYTHAEVDHLFFSITC